MFSKFRNQLKTALETRRAAVLPDTSLLVASVIIFTLIYCVLAVFIVPSDKPPEFNFQEGGGITALSAIYLSVGCGFAVAANLIHFRIKGKIQWLWIVVAFGLGYLAADELLQLHERIGRLVIERFVPRTFFRNWNDAIVVAYGIASLPVMLALLPKLLSYRRVAELFCLAFAFYAVHTIIDSTQDPATLLSNVFEESAKVICAAFLALGSFTGLLGNIWEHVSPRAKRPYAALRPEKFPAASPVNGGGMPERKSGTAGTRV